MLFFGKLGYPNHMLSLQSIQTRWDSLISQIASQEYQFGNMYFDLDGHPRSVQTKNPLTSIEVEIPDLDGHPRSVQTKNPLTSIEVEIPDLDGHPRSVQTKNPLTSIEVEIPDLSNWSSRKNRALLEARDQLTLKNTDANYRKPSNHLWRQAVLGHSEAQYQVGLWYHQGTSPVQRDLTQARSWFSLAAEKGHLLALQHLGKGVLPPRKPLHKTKNQTKLNFLDR